MLCCTVLRCAALCCAVLHSAVLCLHLLRCNLLRCGVLWCADLCCAALWCGVVWCLVVRYAAICCAVARRTGVCCCIHILSGAVLDCAATMSLLYCVVLCYCLYVATTVYGCATHSLFTATCACRCLPLRVRPFQQPRAQSTGPFGPWLTSHSEPSVHLVGQICSSHALARSCCVCDLVLCS